MFTELKANWIAPHSLEADINFLEHVYKCLKDFKLSRFELFRFDLGELL